MEVKMQPMSDFAVFNVRLSISTMHVRTVDPKLKSLTRDNVDVH